MSIKEWTEAECRELIQVLMARYDIHDVRVSIRQRQRPGTYSCRRRRMIGGDWVWSNRTLTLASWLFDGLYRGLSVETYPVKRMLVTLHECAHMIFHKTNALGFQTQYPHGQGFRNLEKLLCGENGWRPLYSDVLKGYASHYVNLEDASEVNIRKTKIERKS